MNTASSDPSQTMTVAAIHVPMPLMRHRRTGGTVIGSATNVEISATPPSAADDD